MTTLQLDSSGKVSTTLGETRILFDGVPAPLVYVSASQASAVVPYEVADKTRTEVQVEYRRVKSNPVLIAVTAATPAVFTANGSGTGQGAILNQDGTVNSGIESRAAGLHHRYLRSRWRSDGSGGYHRSSYPGCLETGSGSPRRIRVRTGGYSGRSALFRLGTGSVGRSAPDQCEDPQRPQWKVAFPSPCGYRLELSGGHCIRQPLINSFIPASPDAGELYVLRRREE